MFTKLNKYLIKELQTIPDVIINTGGKVSSHIVNFSCIGYNQKLFCMLWRKKIFLFLQGVRVVLKQVMFLG